MKEKTLQKSILREIKASFGRFISIFLIVALGVAFYAGVKGSAPVMKQSADAYYDQYRLMDVQFLSTLGLDEDDINAIKEIDGIEAVYGGYSHDVLVQQGNIQQVYKVLSLPSDYQQNPNHYMNRLRLMEGRLPQKKGECVIEYVSLNASSPEIGTTITLQSGNEDDLKDTLDEDTYTIVGKVFTPYYLSYEKGSSSIGSGSVNWYIYILEDHFQMDYFTEGYVTIQNVRQINSYEDDYFDIVEPLVEQMEAVLDQSVTARYLDLHEEGITKINDAKAEYEDGKKEFEDAIRDGQAEIDDGYQKILDGEAELLEKEAEVNAELADAKEQLEDGEQQLKDGQKAYQDGKKEFETKKKEALEAKPQLEDGIKLCKDTIADLKTKLETVNAQLANPVLPDETIAELEAGKIQLEQGLSEANTQLTSLKTNQTQLNEGIQQCLTTKETLTLQLTTVNEQLQNPMLPQDMKATLEASKIQLEAGLAQIDAQLSELNANLTLVEDGITQCETAIVTLNAQLNEVNETLANPVLPDNAIQELESAKTQLEDGITQAESQLSELEANLTQLNDGLADGEAQLQTAQQELEDAKAELTKGWQEYEDGKVEAKEEFAKARQDLADARVELADAQNTLFEEQAKGEKELKDGWQKIVDAQADFEKLEEPDIYVLDRHKHYSYMDYGSAADRMAAIAKIFPVFFFLVAALVCLTTMTRMVDEHRLEIGTLKALGYSRFSIAKKYVVYAALASISGGIFGAIAGLIVFPMIIYYTWGIMYNMTGIVLLSQIPLALTAIGLCCGITILSALGACYKEVVEVPSQLMRPKAPKSGKKILLERIPFLWNKFSFSHKVTARNIFRYKKRFFMTVIGISGCTALLLSGFGIQDSIGRVAIAQYGEIFCFDANIELDDKMSDVQYQNLCQDLSQNENTLSYGAIQIEPATYDENGTDKALDIYVPMNDYFDQFISIHQRQNKELLTLTDDSVIISEKLSMRMNLEIGDTLVIKNQDEVKAEVTVGGICENYVGHIVYMTPTYYQKCFKEEANITNILIDMEHTDLDYEQAYGEFFMQEEGVNAISFNAGVAQSFEETIHSISLIVIVLTVCAGLLAFIVLYNLTTVNVSERIREIATIKVLGFTDQEVASYVYRENIVLTMIGAICGLGLGIWLHQMIMSLAELESVMFGRNIDPLSYIYSFVITLVFAFLVNLVMYPKLSKIQMVESLKSIE